MDMLLLCYEFDEQLIKYFCICRAFTHIMENVSASDHSSSLGMFLRQFCHVLLK